MPSRGRHPRDPRVAESPDGPSLSLVGLDRVECHRDDASAAVELARFDRIDAYELAALHLHPYQALAAHSAADVGRRDETAGVEVVEVGDGVEHGLAGETVGPVR